MTHSTPTIYHVAAARDALKVNLRPACLVVHRDRILQVGRPEQINLHDFPTASHVHLPQTLVLPAMVNAHAHLDLAALGPMPWPGNPDHFDQWLWQIMQKKMDEQAIEASVLEGWQASRSAGVGLIGDIARSMSAVRALGHTGARWRAVSFLERFGQGQRQPQAIAELDAVVAELMTLQEATGINIGLEAHAPYSAGLALYQAMVLQSQRTSSPGPLRLTTHLAETAAEDQFIRHATGSMADMLRRIGKWDDTITACHQSPVQRLATVFQQAHWLVAHCNYVDDQDITTLADTGTSVAYCPIASSYFGHQNHRYREMLAAGVNVCLGTDSMLCQRPDEPQPMGIMPQIRLLFTRDGTDPAILLAMATTHGARALGADEALVTLQADSPAELTAVSFNPHDPTDALTQVLGNHHPVRLLSACLDTGSPAPG